MSPLGLDFFFLLQNVSDEDEWESEVSLTREAEQQKQDTHIRQYTFSCELASVQNYGATKYMCLFLTNIKLYTDIFSAVR